MEASGEGRPVSPPAGFRVENVVRLMAVTLAVFYVFSRFIPAAAMQDYMFPDDVDTSWTMALHEAFVQHLQFGTELVFTYGPWGFLARGYHPQTWPIAGIVWSGLALVFISAGWRFARQWGCRPVCAWLWLILLAALATTPLGNDIDTRLLLFVTLLLLLHFVSENTATAKALLVMALGCLSLVKFTGMVETAFVLCLISADDVFRRRRFPWAAPLWLASLLFFWLLAGQRLASIGPFLGNSFQIAAGYTEAMMLPGDAPVWMFAGFVTIAIALWLMAAWLMWPQLRRWTIVPLAGVGMILFIAFKLGFVRHDMHLINSAMSLLVMAALLLPLARGKTGMVQGATMGLLFVTGVFGAAVFHGWPASSGLASQLAGTFRFSNLFAPVSAAGTGYLKTERQKELAVAAAKLYLPPIRGGADLYDFGQLALFAHGVSYQPRPVIQSYSAYTPTLARMNAGWLRSGHAATNLLFAIQPMDDRFRSLEDGLSWPELLTRYEISPDTGPAGSYLLLQRSPAPRGYRLVPLTNVVTQFGTSLEIPAVTTGPVWVEVEIKKTFAGKILSALYKPPMLSITVSTRDHGPKLYRIIPGMAQAGFLLSPVVTDTSAFAALFDSGWPAKLADWEARAMMIEAGTSSHTSLCYEPAYLVHFYRLELSP